jgi:arginyl-tRNA synthetase
LDRPPAPANEPLGQLRAELSAAASRLREPDGELQAVVERPPRPEFGDYSTNLALLLAPTLKAPPREVAERIGADLRERLGTALDRAEVAGPGFLNLFLSDEWFRRALAGIRARGDEFGAGVVPDEARERILVEFVSANPTGPLTVAGGRHAAYGDSLARVLEFAGHGIEREYYVNDWGTQVRRFGESIAARITGTSVPEGGYEGDYVRELAEQARAEGIDPGDVDALARRGVELMMERVRATLERFRVHHDRFFSERSLHESAAVGRGIAELAERGHVYEHEGATWLRTTTFGDDKDRVLLRSSGEETYFAADIAYHQDKRGRGYDRIVNLLGADHHGYMGRMLALFEALGDAGRLEIVIMQLVQVVERGERAQMSKRRGDFVTLDELIDDIGVDAARFFLLQRSPDTPLDLDLDLAREHSQENPVYYVQYAHARIASILRNAGEERLAGARAADLEAGTGSLEPAERALVKRLLALPDEVREAAERRAPHRLTGHAHAIASDFHAFYRDCRVVGAEGDGMEEWRLSVCLETQRAIARVLGLLGVDAPERM